ncbi:MAG: DEAD/DEAH box helicase, partial [Pseudomonadota bacterium]
DEADQMLDMGFIHALRQIAPLLAEDRQTMLFSTTMPKQMGEIAGAYLRDPVRVEAARPGKAADKVKQSLHFVPQPGKKALLIKLLGEHKGERALVFHRTKHGAEKLMKDLVKAGFDAASIHGNKSQGQRDRAIVGFKSGQITVLVATDVAARGLHIDDVAYVYNFDLPNVPDNYVHRIGRTARAGAEGIAISFCAEHEMGELRDIERTMKNRIPVASGDAWAVAVEPKKGKPGNNRRRPRRRNGGNRRAA